MTTTRCLVEWASVAITTGAIAMSAVVAQDRGGSVRPAYCAGTWYPGDKASLAKEVDSLLDKAAPPSVPGKPIAVISPHAGYRYSAPVAAAGYKCLRGHTYKRVIVMAFSHRFAGAYRGVDVPAALTAYDTPLGQVQIDRGVCDDLLKKPAFSSNPDIDRGEHSLELQLPLLQRAVKDFRLVPLLVGRMSDRDYVAAAEAIVRWTDDDTLLVASSDCTHFGPNYGYEPFREDAPKKLRELGDAAAAPILACDFDGFVEHLDKTGDTICGRGPICLLLRVLSMKAGASGLRAAFDTSGNLTGDWTNSVTYQSFVFTRRPAKLSEQERAELLKLARQTVTAFVNDKDLSKPDPGRLPAAIREKGACFVTLENRGRLRGCIGNMAAEGPLFEAVVRNAELACQDHRFLYDPVTAKEVEQLHIEISYLTPMKRVQNVKEIIVGRDGLLIGQGPFRGVLLPQVAYERGWTREEFLAETCRKANLPTDAWKKPDAEIHSFEAEVFGESQTTGEH